jgi:hypothetical protein
MMIHRWTREKEIEKEGRRRKREEENSVERGGEVNNGNSKLQGGMGDKKEKERRN